MKFPIITFLLLICASFFTSTFPVLADTTDTGKKTAAESYFKNYYQSHNKPTENVQVPENSSEEANWVQDRLCIALLTFALLLCAGEILLFLKGRIDQQMIIKLLILTLVIFSILFLITAGYDNSQTQTSVGLLGTIAGYLLGRTIPDSAQPVQPVAANNPDTPVK